MIAPKRRPSCLALFPIEGCLTSQRRRFGKEMLEAVERLVLGCPGAGPEAPEPGAEDDAPLQVVPEEAVAGRMAQARGGPGLGDSPGGVVGMDHLDVRPAVAPGAGDDPGDQRVRFVG